MNNSMKKILSILILALASMNVNAQDDFHPTLPGEPNAQYKVTVGISYPEAGSVYGAGSYKTGTEVTISKSDAWFSSNSSIFYKFRYWTLNGEEYSSEPSFTYTIGTENAHFVAVYDMLPIDDATSKVYIVVSPDDASDYHVQSGQRYLEGNEVYIYCSGNTGFVFKGWYKNDKLISESRNFYYLVGKEDVTLTAKFEYKPSIPGEPDNNGQTDIDRGTPPIVPGDANSDGVISVADLSLMASYILGEEADINIVNSDINGDGKITVADLSNVASIILGAN